MKQKTGKQLLHEALIPKKYKGYRVKVDNRMKDFGFMDEGKRLVKINRKKSLKLGGRKELVDTIEHEKYHVRHPKAFEKTTYKAVEKITGRKTKAKSTKKNKIKYKNYDRRNRNRVTRVRRGSSTR